MRRQATSAAVVTAALFALAACRSSHQAASPQPGGTNTWSFAPPTAYVTLPERAAHTNVLDAYGMLHKLGLRVAIPKQFGMSSLTVPEAVLVPKAGTRLRVGSTVQMTAGVFAAGSPATQIPTPHARVPAFTGQPLSVAIDWVGTHNMFWFIPAVPPLPASDAGSLFDAYRVVGQKPSAGQILVPGVTVGRTFSVTPLTLTVRAIAQPRKD